MADNKDTVSASQSSQKTYPLQKFDSILVLTDKVTFPEATRTYQGATALIADNDDADIQALASLVFSQEKHAKTLILAKRTKPKNAVVSFTFDTSLDAINNGEFAMTINGTATDIIGLDFTVGTKAEAFNAILNPANIVAYDIDANTVEFRTVLQETTASITDFVAVAGGVGTDISAVLIASTTSNTNGQTGITITEELVLLDEANVDYFGVLVVSVETQGDLIALAQYVETLDAILGLYDNSPLTKGTETTDLSSSLKALSLEKSFSSFHTTGRLDIAFLSRFLGQDIGTLNAKTLTLKGIVADAMSNTELTNVLGKNANVYLPERKNYTFFKQGTTASGKKIEDVAGEIFVNVSTINAVYELMLNQDRISFDAEDMNLIRVAVTRVMKTAQAQSIVANDDAELGTGFDITIIADRATGGVTLEIKYLKAGSVDWIEAKYSAYIDDADFYITKEV